LITHAEESSQNMELNAKTFTKTKMRPNEYNNYPRCKKV
jgi:hypothetical protein